MSLVNFEVNWTIPSDVLKTELDSRGFVKSTIFSPPHELGHLFRFHVEIYSNRYLCMYCSSQEDCKVDFQVKTNILNLEEQGKF
mgnify:CR=1 FL=1